MSPGYGCDSRYKSAYSVPTFNLFRLPGGYHFECQSDDLKQGGAHVIRPSTTQESMVKLFASNYQSMKSLEEAIKRFKQTFRKRKCS